MTPIPQLITKDCLLPLKQRRFCIDLKFLDGFHFFEASEVADAAFDLAQRTVPRKLVGKLAFLPAPKIWIEVRVGSRSCDRVAYLLEQDGDAAKVRLVILNPDGMIEKSDNLMWLPLVSADAIGTYSLDTSGWSLQRDDAAPDSLASVLYAYLALINTPRIIGRRQHMPHRGLERRLIQQRPAVGKFPLRAWTELLLRVTPPQIDDTPSREAHLTGQRARHFVRCHLRIRLGQLELVSAHWRGELALGIKQTRYKVAA